MKRFICALTASAAVGMLGSSTAQAQGRTPSSPWSRLFVVPTDRPDAATRSFDFLARIHIVRAAPAIPCSRIVSKPVDPAFDSDIRRAAPTEPAPASRSIQTRTCKPSK